MEGGPGTAACPPACFLLRRTFPSLENAAERTGPAVGGRKSESLLAGVCWGPFPGQSGFLPVLKRAAQGCPSSQGGHRLCQRPPGMLTQGRLPPAACPRPLEPLALRVGTKDRYLFGRYKHTAHEHLVNNVSVSLFEPSQNSMWETLLSPLLRGKNTRLGKAGDSGDLV